MSEQLPVTTDSPTGAPATAPRERGWRGVVLAVLAFVAVPLMGPARLATPVEQTLLLLVPAIAVCMLLGWWAGGRLSHALIWLALGAWMVVQPMALDPLYGKLALGWALLLATAFGVVSLASPSSRFFPRALSAVGLALAGGLVMLVVTRTTGDVLTDMLTTLYRHRVEEMLLFFTQDPQWQAMTAKNPDAAQMTTLVIERVRAMQGPAVRLAPAFLALESLAALALAWAVYHRIARVRLGAPLAPLRDFRFSDQLVWGLIVGLVAALFPSLADLRTFGFNLLLFFGALYALRGFGVLSFLLPGRFVTAMLVSAALFFPLVAAFALGMGLGDTWLDWRSRARPTPTH